jgi:hypothetical protein
LKCSHLLKVQRNGRQHDYSKWFCFGQDKRSNPNTPLIARKIK